MYIFDDFNNKIISKKLVDKSQVYNGCRITDVITDMEAPGTALALYLKQIMGNEDSTKLTGQVCHELRINCDGDIRKMLAYLVVSTFTMSILKDEINRIESKK